MESSKNQSNALVIFKNFLAISLIFFVIAFLHYPLLLNAPLVLQFDEGIHASEIIRLMKGEAFFFYFDYARYHGILHGLFAIPFFWLMGISATAYKLPPILFYAAYVWTSYLLAKTINKNVAVITLLLLIVPSPAFSFLVTHNWQNSIIVVLGNLILLFYFNVQSSNKKLLWAFWLFFIIGLAIYEYTYSIIYFTTIVFMFALSHPLWSETRSKISFKKVIQHIKDSKTRFDSCLKIFDAIILLMFTATLFAYVWGGFAIDIFHVSILQIHKFNKAGLQVLILVVLRLVISRKFLYEYQQWIFGLFKKIEPKQWKLIRYGLFGFLSGISPRIISILQGNTSKGGKGFDMNIDPISFSKHIWTLITIRIPDILGIREPLIRAFNYSSYEGFGSSLNNVLSIVILFLILIGSYKFLQWKWDSLKKVFLLKKINHDPALAFMLLPLFVVFANILTENGPITLRYAYPFLGIILIWVAFFIEKIRKESLVIPLAIIVLWASFQGLNIYSFYKESGMIDGLTPVKKPFPLKSALDFLKSKNTRFVYTGFYTAIQAQLVETPEMLVTSNGPRNWGRLSREKPVSPDNFAIIVSSIGSNTDLDFYMADDLYEYSHASKKQEAARIETLKNNQYRKFLDENQIIYKNKRIGPHHIFWNIQANKEQFESLKKL